MNNMKPYNVILYDFNKNDLEQYDVMPYLVEMYSKSKSKPKTVEEFKKFIESESMYQFWGRCEYEIIVSSWPPSKRVDKKIDAHWQIMMNIDIVTEILMDNVMGWLWNLGHIKVNHINQRP